MKEFRTYDDFDESALFEDDFDIEAFIESASRKDRRRRRRSASSYRELRLEEKLLGDELADWDSYDD